MGLDIFARDYAIDVSHLTWVVEGFASPHKFSDCVGLDIFVRGYAVDVSHLTWVVEGFASPLSMDSSSKKTSPRYLFSLLTLMTIWLFLVLP